MIFNKTWMKSIAFFILVAFVFTYGLPTQQVLAAHNINNLIKANKAPSIKYEKVKPRTKLGSLSTDMDDYYLKIKASFDKQDLIQLKADIKDAKKALAGYIQEVSNEFDASASVLNKLNAKNAIARHNKFKTEFNQKMSSFDVLFNELDEMSGKIKGIKAQDSSSLKDKLDELGRIIMPEQPQQPLAALPHNNVSVNPPAPATGAGTSAAYMAQTAGASISALPRTPTGEDLAETPETKQSEEIKTLADSLGTPVNIYEYVRNNIEFEPYYGSRKGALGTLNQMNGNDYDQASLLIAMLRYKGIPSRYVNGTVEVPIEKVKSWTGTQTAEAAVKVLGSLGVPTVSVVSGGTIVAARLEHTWVEAYVPYENYRGAGEMKGEKIWVPIDPSFKQYSIEEGLDIKAITGVTDEQILDAFKINADSSIYGDTITNVNIDQMSSFLDDSTEKLQQYLKDNNLENADAKQLIGGKKIIPENLGLLPLTLPYKTVTVLSETNTIPDASSEEIGFYIRGNDPFNLNFSGSYDFDVQFRAAELYGKRITLSWIPASQEDEDIIDSYGGIFNTPAYMIQLKPQLKADGQVIAEGNAAGFGNRQEFTIAMGHVGSAAENVVNPVTVGGFYSISFDYGKIDVKELNEIKDRISAVKDTATEASIYTDEVMGEILNSVGKAYFGQLDGINSIIANAMKVNSIRQVSEAMTGYRPNVRYMFNTPVEVTGGSFFIDVDHDVFGVTSLEGNKEKEIGYMMNTGMLGSAMEHGIHEQIFQLPSVSSIKLLTEASNRGIPIYTIGKHNIDKLSEISATSSVKTDVTNAVNSGKIVVIPQKEINYYNWQGAGYIVMDPETGAAGYMISGGLAGGSAAIDVVVTLVGLAALAWAIFDTISIAMAFIAATNPIIAVIFFSLYIISVINVIITLDNMISYWQTGNYEYASKLMNDLIMNIAFYGVFKVLDWILPGILALFKGVKNQMDDVARAADNLGDDIAEAITRHNGPDLLPEAEKVVKNLGDKGIDPGIIKKIADEQGLDGLNTMQKLLDSGKVTKEQLADFVDEGLNLKNIGKFMDDGMSADSAVKLTKAMEDGIITPDAWKGELLSQTGDATHLTNRGLSEINNALKEGKNVDIDMIKTLKNQADALADGYASKINNLSEDTLANLSKQYPPSAQPSKILSDELEAAGIVRPADSECHHIVPANQVDQSIRDILSENGININSAANGVYLPKSADAAWPGQVTHSAFSNYTDAGNPMFRHGQVYINYISDNIKEISEQGLGKQGLLDFLEQTRKDLLDGNIDFLYND